MKQAIPLLTLLAIACGGERASTEDAAESAQQTDTATQADTSVAGEERAGTALPKERKDTIQIEGMPEESVSRLVESPPGFEPAFHTYVPEDLTDEQVSSDEGTAWRFNARFAGVENPEAFVLVHFYPENTTDEQAKQKIESLIGDRRRVQRDPGMEQRYPWSELEQSYRGTSKSGQPIVGSVALGRHDGRLFHLVIEYPAEYGDGFGPRAHRVLSEWKWVDGSSLGS